MAEQSVSLPLNWRDLHVDELRLIVAGRGPDHMPHYAYRKKWQIIKWIEEHFEKVPRRCPTCGHLV